jgi:RNA polymerase sigma factor (sigma-70 family)
MIRIHGRRRLENYNYEPHPDLQKTYETHKGLCWWWAYKASRIFGDKPSAYIGTVVMKVNLSLKYFKESGGAKLTTYISNRMIDFVAQSFVAFESESWSLRAMMGKDTWDKTVTNKNFAFHEADYHLYRVPDVDDDYCLDLINDNFSSFDEAWSFLVSGLNARQERILVGRFRDDRSLEDIGVELGVTKERVRQIQEQALKVIRHRLKRLEDFSAIFKAIDEREKMDEKMAI